MRRDGRAAFRAARAVAFRRRPLWGQVIAEPDRSLLSARANPLLMQAIRSIPPGAVADPSNVPSMRAEHKSALAAWAYCGSAASARIARREMHGRDFWLEPITDRAATAARRCERDRTGRAPAGLPPDCDRSGRGRLRNNRPAGRLRPVAEVQKERQRPAVQKERLRLADHKDRLRLAVHKDRLRLVDQKGRRANFRTSREDSPALRAPGLPPVRRRARERRQQREL